MSTQIEVRLNGRRLRKGQAGYDARHRAELDRRAAVARKAAKEGDKARFREAWALQYIKDEKLYLQDGIGDFDEWVEKRLERSATTVRRRLALAEEFSRQHVEEHGVTKLLLAREYANRTLSDEDGKVDVTSLVFVLPHKDGVAEVPFRDVTEPQIERALKHQRSLAQRRARAALPEALQQAIGSLQTALTPPGREDALVRISGKASRSGLEADNIITLEFRFGDFEAVLERVGRLAPEPRRGGGR